MALRLVKEYELLKKVDYLDNYPLNTKFKKPALCAGFFRYNTGKWLVKSSESCSNWGFARSLVKTVSLNFFCL